MSIFVIILNVIYICMQVSASKIGFLTRYQKILQQERAKWTPRWKLQLILKLVQLPNQIISHGISGNFLNYLIFNNLIVYMVINCSLLTKLVKLDFFLFDWTTRHKQTKLLNGFFLCCRFLWGNQKTQYYRGCVCLRGYHFINRRDVDFSFISLPKLYSIYLRLYNIYIYRAINQVAYIILKIFIPPSGVKRYTYIYIHTPKNEERWPKAFFWSFVSEFSVYPCI